MSNNKQKVVEEDIPSNYVNKFASISRESWKHEDFRNKVINLCNEHMSTEIFTNKAWANMKEFLLYEGFINKVKSISASEVKSYVDKSRVKTVFWILGLVIATMVGLFMQKVFKIF